ncbi:uncharacterized protein si:dkeyp-110g5.4 isoform X1 [Silurus meridionalis]|uniref:uncharacterized protein si:dkeyp-110g5.4 isoform X1 n=1 Tax=Silurus meridionalis TaxID=175797 RepID=UPI001EEA0CB2|nr:uncharacterized protein si:dkeyp-110g5.4 isoform X1 [Silurus meridionalis]XP_046726492.1 uncharacterized protein si:dkeyp-110g5.4 isoform X1 [Silurus meridionalis]XP_046726493.1 uncharacterized protein si:dkeyp-110g5.4 isoform X1 [Silurus meridionalis]
MPSSGDTEVFIPEQASVITVPVCCLPSSITRKMSMCLVHSTCPATFISPVELRNKGTTETPRPLTPGQVLLPVVTSNQKAFRILQRFLHSGENSLQIPDETSPAGSSFSRRSHSIVLFDKQIFLVVTKAKACDWSLKKRNPTPYECEAPPLDSPVTTSSLQDGGNDITDGRNKEGTCGAEDDEKCAEKQGGDGLMECEEQNDDDDELTDRRRSEDGAGAAEEHGKCSEASEERVRSDPLRKDVSTNMPQQIKMEEKRGVSTAVGEAQGAPANADERTDEDSATETRLCAQSQTGNEQSSGHLETGDSEYQQSSAKPKCCKRINFPAAQSPSDVNDRQDKIEVKGQVGELDGEVTDTNNGDRVLQDAGENSDVDDPKSNGGDPSSSCESDVEIVDVLDSSGSAGIRSSASKVENFLEKCENLKRIINEYVHSQGSPFTRLKRDDVAMETGANRDVAKGEFKVEMNSEPICQAKNSNRDVEIIEVVDDDDEDEETSWTPMT